MYPISETVVLGPEDSGSEHKSFAMGHGKGGHPPFTALFKSRAGSATKMPFLRAPFTEGVMPPRFLWDANSGWLPRSAICIFMTDEYSEIDEGCLECTWDVDAAQAARMNTRYPKTLSHPTGRRPSNTICGNPPSTRVQGFAHRLRRRVGAAVYPHPRQSW